MSISSSPSSGGESPGSEPCSSGCMVFEGKKSSRQRGIAVVGCCAEKAFVIRGRIEIERSSGVRYRDDFAWKSREEPARAFVAAQTAQICKQTRVKERWSAERSRVFRG